MINPEQQKLRTYKKKVKNKKGETVEYIYRKSYPDIKHDCECGGKYSRTNKSHHDKTKRHKRYVDI